MSQAANPSSALSHPAQAAPPSKSEIERKLSFRSASTSSPRAVGESPKKKKPVATSHLVSQPSGNDSDTSSVTSSSHPAVASPVSPTLTPATSGGLSAIVERKPHALGSEGELDDMELEDVEEEEVEGEGEDSDAEADAEQQGQLNRGMEGERMVKSGFLYKKQERRKVWKKKWFVLRTGKLAYYKDDREYSLSRVLDLKQVHTVAPVTVKKHPFTFGIVTSKRTFFAKANSQDEMDSWVQAINGARRKLSEREEEERNKRGMAISTKERGGDPDAHPHPGTYSSVFSTASQGSAPIGLMAGPTGYFTHNPNNQPVPVQATPSPSSHVPSPLDTTNTLTSQMAKVQLPNSPSGLSSPRLPGAMTAPQSQNRSVSTSTQREPSASSIGSSTENRPRALSGGIQTAMGIGMVSSDEDEAYFSDPNAAFQGGGSGQPLHHLQQVVDPKKVILSAYLMKRSKGRGRKLWRKRWFYLTSQGLTYTKSHMDTRALRFIPLTSVLDALEFDPAESAADSSDSEDDRGEMSPPSRQAYLSSIRRRADDTSTPKRDKAAFQVAAGTGADTEHIFRLITAKRTYVLCAPSEEDEIKWLAAFRALLNRERERSQSLGGPVSPSLPSGPLQSPTLAAHAQGQGPAFLPIITQQPPTPATAGGGGECAENQNPASSNGPSGAVGSFSGPGTSSSTSTTAPHNEGPPLLGKEITVASTSDAHAGHGGHWPQAVHAGQGAGGQGGQGGLGTGGQSALGQGQGQNPLSNAGTRGRSATYTAKSAVADVVRRFRDEREGAH